MKKLLICLMLLFGMALTACGNDAAAETDAPPAAAETGETAGAAGETAGAAGETDPVETEPAETTRADRKDTLPEGLNFNDTTLNFILREEMALYDATGDNGGDIIYDAVYKRNVSVEERLGVKLNYILEGFDFNLMAAKVEKSVLGGLDEYDVVMQRGMQTFSQVMKKMYRDLNDAPHLNLEQPWWWMDTVRDTSINTNQVYFLTGDMSLSTFLASTACFVNKEMLADYSLSMDELYDLVEEGKWTYEQFEKYCANVYEDVNGDGLADLDDIYGFGYVDYGPAWYYYSAGLKFTTRDENGNPILNLNNEQTVKMLEVVEHMLKDNNYAYYEPSDAANDFDLVVGKFMEEEALFLMGRFMYTNQLRDFDKPYGVVPYPKLDETVDYMSGTGASGNFISVPTTCEDFEATCAALEAMGAENYRTVFPAFYEGALKLKYADGTGDARMVDIIHDSIYVDFLYISPLNTLTNTIFTAGSQKFSSIYAALGKSLDNTLNTMIEEYNALND